MNVRDEQRDRVVEALAAHLLRTGLAQASLRQLAAAAGVSDRMLLYYFSDKAEVLALAMERLAADMALRLATALPEGERLSQTALTARAARLVVDETFRPFMRLWIEAVAAAARGEVPFVEIAARIGEGFLVWLEDRLDPATTVDPAGTAAAILALLDGLALLEVCVGGPRTLRAVEALERQADAEIMTSNS
jgi:AcrR family transcriptional regulator